MESLVLHVSLNGIATILSVNIFILTWIFKHLRQQYFQIVTCFTLKNYTIYKYFILICLCIYRCKGIYICVCAFYMYIYTHIYVWVYIYMYIYTHTYMYLHLYLFIYRERERGRWGQWILATCFHLISYYCIEIAIVESNLYKSYT